MTEKLQQGRLDHVLDQVCLINESHTTLRRWLAEQSTFDCKETDGMINFNRQRYKRMSEDDQERYEVRLKAQRLYWVNNVGVPKIVYDMCLRQSVQA